MGLYQVKLVLDGKAVGQRLSLSICCKNLIVKGAQCILVSFAKVLLKLEV